MKRVIGTMVILVCFAFQANAVNFISNGDFESGNTGFFTNYTYSPLSIVEPQTYTIDTDPAHAHYKCGSFHDHTSGIGNMMIVNSSTYANKVAWQQSVAVISNTDYTFSFWCMNWSSISYNLARLEYTINGVQLGNVTVPATAGSWSQASTTWNSGLNNTATILIVETGLYYDGGDFAIDDITMVPEPGTICVLGLGGLAILRKRK